MYGCERGARGGLAQGLGGRGGRGNWFWDTIGLGLTRTVLQAMAGLARLQGEGERALMCTCCCCVQGVELVVGG